MSAAHAFVDRIADLELERPYGFVRKVANGHFEASGPGGLIGSLCEVETPISGAPLLAEIAAVDQQGVVLVPLQQDGPIALGARVTLRTKDAAVPVGDGYAGRAVDALGCPIDGRTPIRREAYGRLAGELPSPLDRSASRDVAPTGIKAIDGLLTLARGQRIGIFAASGVGKTSLIEQLALQTACDRCVLCLVGERGREVEGIWRSLPQGAARRRYTLVAATSDESAAMRARSVSYALALAEYWRARGEHVLLIVDSITRLAMALREIGLAAGEPPTVRAYTPNVFAALPRIVERCGAVRSGGAITAVMTVLSETDDVDDPIVEVMKSLLDGHVILSRTLAERGHFPAIDIARSISRQATSLMAADHARAARGAVAALGIYDESRVMIESGVYQPGSNTDIDRAIALRSALQDFLRQPRSEHVPYERTVEALRSVMKQDRA